MPKGSVPTVDRLLDQAQEVRMELHGQACESRNHLHAALQELMKAWNALVVIETTTAGADHEGEGGGELFDALREIRETPAVRRASSWDGTERRRMQVAA